MKNLIMVICVAIAASGLTACGKDSETVAQNRAQSLVEQQNALVHEINAMGTPSSAWSDAELNDLEAKLNRLEQIESEIEEENFKNGVVVTGAQNSMFISTRRAQIRAARESQNSSSSVSGNLSELETLDKISKNNRKMQSLTLSIDHDNLASWTTSEARMHMDTLDELLGMVDEQRQLWNSLARATPGDNMNRELDKLEELYQEQKRLIRLTFDL